MSSLHCLNQSVKAQPLPYFCFKSGKDKTIRNTKWTKRGLINRPCRSLSGWQRFHLRHLTVFLHRCPERGQRGRAVLEPPVLVVDAIVQAGGEVDEDGVPDSVGMRDADCVTFCRSLTPKLENSRIAGS